MFQKLKVGQEKIIKGQNKRKICDIEDKWIEDFIKMYQTKAPMSIIATRNFQCEKGQVWSNSKDKFVILKEWDKFYIIKNKFGEREKILKTGLTEKIQNGRFKVIDSTKFQLLIGALSALIIPYLGVLWGTALMALIAKIIKKRGIK